MIGFLAVLVLGMGVAAVLAYQLVEKLYIDTQRENLLAQANLTAAALQGGSFSTEVAQPYTQSSNVQPGIHTRLLNDQGAVLVGLPLTGGNISLPLAENVASIPPDQLLERTEIQKALKGEGATAIRKVASAGNRRVLYAAAPVYGLNGGVNGLVYLAMPLPRAGLPVNMLLELAAALLAGTVLAATAGIFIARRISRPLEAIAEAATAVSEGDLTQRVPPEKGIQELANLGEAFNRMTEGLRQADQVKNAFVADVTHELRTPLTVIKGTLETLEDGALNDAEGRGPLLASMHRETDRLIRLVNDLLVLTRADAGKLNLRQQPLDLAELARNRCEYLAPLAAQRQVQLSVVTGDASKPSIIIGDTDRLSQVLDNLIDNAIRYSPEGGLVSVEVSKKGEDYECAVRDCGPGIPPEHLKLIFERFYRVDRSRNRQTGGAGLGLAIARALVLAQGGHIYADSVVGKGTTLHFTMPASGDCQPTG